MYRIDVWRTELLLADALGVMVSSVVAFSRPLLDRCNYMELSVTVVGAARVPRIQRSCGLSDQFRTLRSLCICPRLEQSGN